MVGARDAALDLDLLAAVASRSSRWPTATSACAATSTRASRAALSGTYLNGFYESYPLEYGERGYGFAEDGQTVVNVTDGKIIRLLVEDEPLDIHRGSCSSTTSGVLDFRAGVLQRATGLALAAGHAVRVRTTRLVSLRRSAASRRSATRSRRSTGRCASRCSPT